MVEIARALSMQSRLIVMDEPTSALSSTEVEKLFRIVRDLKAQGLSIIFVTHRLEEVMEICDRYTVLRDGRQVGGGKVADTDVDGIIRLMVGRQLERAVRPSRGDERRRSRAQGRGPVAPRQRAGPDRHRARRRHRSRCAAAKSSASPGWSAPAAPRWRARCSAPIRSTPGRVFIDGERVDIRSPAGRHPPRRRPGPRGPQAAGAVPVAGASGSISAWRRTSDSCAGGVFIDEARRAARWSRNSARR